MYKNGVCKTKTGRHMRSMRLAAAVSSEIARMVVLEFESEISGSARGNYLNTHYQKLLKNIRIYTEFACAKGGVIFKPYVSNDGICFNAVQADAFFPTAFDSSGRITGVVFTERLAVGKSYYTRVEIHSLQGGRYEVVNKAFKSENGAILGSEVSLGSVAQWSDIAEKVEFKADFPLFSYFKYPGANYIDSESPLGVSAFAKACDLIEDAGSPSCGFSEQSECRTHGGYGR